MKAMTAREVLEDGALLIYEGKQEFLNDDPYGGLYPIHLSNVNDNVF